MPPNSPQTLLSLEAFREIIGYDPYFFYGLANQKKILTDSSDMLVSEYTWQRPNAAGRSDFRSAISSAEQKLSTALGYDVSTRYRRETISLGLVRQRYGVGITNLKVGKLQRVATVTYEELGWGAGNGAVAVTISDENNDQLGDTFTGTFTDSETDPALVIVAFSSGDRIGPARVVSDPLNWQVRGARVTRLNDSTLEITGPSWLLVKPALYEKAIPANGYNSSQTGIDSSGSLDPGVATNFVTGLTLYKKVYTDEAQALLVRRYGGEETTYPVSVTVLDAELGQAQINFYGCYGSYPAWCGGPYTEEIQISYEAGATNSSFEQAGNLDYQTDWDTVVARFAIAELAADPAVTQKRSPQLYYWREDMALVGSGQQNNLYRVANPILENGFKNTRRGAVEAWQKVVSLAQLRAVNLS